MAKDLLAPHLKSIRVPSSSDRVYKDECIFSYDTPDSPDGIYVCMKTFYGFGRPFVGYFHQKTNNSVFLNLRRIAHPVIQVPDSDEDASKPKVTRLALNVEGGFQTNKPQFTYEDVNTIVVMPGFVEISLDQMNQMDLPEVVVMSLTGILSADSASRQAELEAMKNTWEGEKRLVSKHAENLVQIDNGVKVSTDPSSWKCQKCDIREGLWLNLSDGSIHCGRKYFDGTGGNNHAEEHYKETQYPLVVKLGTINSQGADVYSYAEDNMVDDPKLVQHLAHFGIHVAMMLKTEKSMLEMEIDLNQRYDEWRIIQEDGCNLKNIYGPGFTGMANLGNSCYLNSIMQVIFSIPDFILDFYRQSKYQLFFEANHLDPMNDLKTQLMKLSSGLLSGEYSKQSRISPSEQQGIKPTMFKNLIGRNHAEFSSKRQQDAQEFLLHIIDAIERMPRLVNTTNLPTDCFKFEVEERMQCEASKMVKYKYRSDFLLSLPIQEVPIQNKEQYEEFLQTKAAVEAAGGKIDNDQVVRPIVKMTDCLSAFAAEVPISDFYSSAIKGKTVANQRVRMKTFPEYLIVHMKKFAYDETFTPKKLDVFLEVPDVLDLEYLRATGLMPAEQLLPDEDADSKRPAASQSFECNAEFLAQLKDMGFDENGVRRALYHTKNAGVEQAMNWVFEHMNDADFAAPFEVPQQGEATAVEIDQEALASLLSMGMEERHARLGLKLNNNNTEQALSWIFNNAGNLDTIERQEEERARAAASVLMTYRDGPPKYELFAMVSHMGQSTLCGHYVAHIRKTITDDAVVFNPKTNKDTVPPSDGSKSPVSAPPSPLQMAGQTEWIIFNDNKVNISEKPPIPFAYLYIYKRITS